MKIGIMFLALFCSVSACGAEFVSRTNLMPLVQKINEGVEKLQLKDDKKFSKFVDSLDAEIIFFSSATSTSLENNLVELISLYERADENSTIATECRQSSTEKG